MATYSINEDEIIEIERDRWTDAFFRPFLITVMIMCLNVSLVNFVRLVNLEWRGEYFLLAMFLTTVEAIYSYRVLQRYITRGISTTRYRLAELVVLILIIKLLGFMGKPPALVGAELQALWQTPALFLLNTEFYVSFILALIAWGAATQTMADFETLYDPYTDNTIVLDSLAERFFWGGGILVVISGITYWVTLSGLASLLNLHRPSIGGVIFNVLLYFTVGLILLSQVNLTRLLVRWRIQKIASPPDLARRWAKYGFIFLGFVTLIAFLLPTSYTLGFLDTAGVIIRFLMDIFVFIFQLLIILLTLPLTWLLSLLGVAPPTTAPAGQPELPPMLETTPGASYPWLEVLRSLIFWLAALAIIGYMLKTYLEDHPELIESLSRFKPFKFLLNLLTQFWSWLRAWTQTGLALIPKMGFLAKKEAGGEAKTAGWGWLGLRNLPARERILAYYFNILEQAKKHGAGRKTHQTPYEYEPRLKQSAPAAQGEIHDLTDVFVRARYSQETFGEEEIASVKREWQQIRKALRRRRQKRGDHSS
jgi:hypothetical protein